MIFSLLANFELKYGIFRSKSFINQTLDNFDQNIF